MRRCEKCGGGAHRIHRSISERIRYLAIYQCRQCHDLSTMPRRFRFHLGDRPRCPKCGTYRISKLKSPDTIDSFQTGFLNAMERMAGGGIYHCKFCRLQFYDRRKSAAERAAGKARKEVEEPEKKKGKHAG
jgi:hypothetical protein